MVLGSFLPTQPILTPIPPFLPDPIGAMEAGARSRVNNLIQSNGLVAQNPDVQRIVDNYFDSTAPNTGALGISAAGFIDSPVTLNALNYVTQTVTDAVAANLPTIQAAIGGSATAGIRTTIGRVVDILGLPSELLSVEGDFDDSGETFYQALWKYEGTDNVPGVIAGGVGRGGAPPADAPTILDRRDIVRDSPVDILLAGGTLNLSANYTVRIGDTFDFEPGGGGYDDTSYYGFGTAIGVEILAFLEQRGRTYDVPFFTQFDLFRTANALLPAGSAEASFSG